MRDSQSLISTNQTLIGDTLMGIPIHLIKCVAEPIALSSYMTKRLVDGVVHQIRQDALIVKNLASQAVGKLLVRRGN